jgi:hypothetical protein
MCQATPSHGPDWKVTSLAMTTMSRPWGYSGVLMVACQAIMPMSFRPTSRRVRTSSLFSSTSSSALNTWGSEEGGKA